MRYTRYEILLPLAHNDGAPVDPALFDQTKRELIRRFGAVSMDALTVTGSWVYRGLQYDDRLRRFRVDVPARRTHDAFFLKYKSRLTDRFRQKDIWLTATDIRVL